ncbi:putative bifunctional diguanylate cyclase/phosphodiesterase [Paraburkholderia phenoliruptrix]|uniref:putative bifunctional diguanylate cyclase/phosphodiesterase n=1 Tax=Paraburkholderia phenoliruptrix TaxID=252970 RepID=UPI001C6EA9D3|nr:bifunctional diguanylate cyclase/phosphodiesterase [Paraburkholderia phenoliruptrix]MBW9102839.1 bifunctional diguanylate cyclase/phosphodiesterase [Paraburkholderia phenoliruptrix]MBW9131371.1 bifunctional diguanylate cyclase/phosphodiesterase [Paraburkholderia ginsengiterrae]
MTEQVPALSASRSDLRVHPAWTDSAFAAATARTHAHCHPAHGSFIDSLTGVYNRAYVTGRAQQWLRSARAAHVAMIVVNLDCFSRINDMADYDLGDRLLRSVAQRLAGRVAANDLLARIGGDEFVIVTDGDRDVPTLPAYARQILGLFAEPFVIAGRAYRVSASGGVALGAVHSRDAAVLMRDAGAAMRRAKTQGPGSLRFFTGDMHEAAQRRFAIEERLRGALDAGEFRLAYQPVVNAAARETVGVEALLRWTSSELGDVSPAEFVPIAEQAGLMESIGGWVLAQACAQVADWRWNIAPDVTVSINISPVQFNEHLVQHVAECLANTGLEPSALQLEITEGMLMPDDPTIGATISALTRMGVRLAIDDFGTGYASMSYLKRFSPHGLKIDRSFVAGLPHDKDCAAIAHALVRMAHACAISVTAEGVETEEQASLLREMGCDFLQGFLFGRPGSAAECSGKLSRASRFATRREQR